MFKYLKPRNPLVALSLLLLLTGCGGGDHPDLYPVSGTVTYKGETVENATVQFYKEGTGRQSQAITDSNGRYELSTYENGDGAPAGEYVVVVTKIESTATEEDDVDSFDPEGGSFGAADPDEGEEDGDGDEEDEPESLLPEKYGSQTDSPLKRSVTAEGPNEFDLELDDE